MNTIRDYIQSALQELNHVTWPTKPQIIKISIIVVIFITVSAVVLGVVDFAFAEFFKTLLNLR